MECETIDRDKYSEELENFIENTDIYINELLTSLNWSKSSIQDGQQPLICPFNSSHHLSEKTLEQHLEKCQWKAEGYDESDLPLSIPPPSSSKLPSCITFDEQLQENVLELANLNNPSMRRGMGGRLIPRTSARLIADFTSDERKILYEYVVANTTIPEIGEDIADLNKPRNSDENKPSSYLELLAQERNLKRRRAKHRGVHTNKKSDTEIFREMINQQMEMLAEYIADKKGYDTTNTAETLHNDEEIKVKKISNHKKEKVFEKNNDNFDFNENHTHNHRSRHSTDDNYHENDRHMSKYRYKEEIKYSKHRRKSSREHEKHQSHHHKSKKHERHHSKHRHRDKNERDRSRERESSRHSKKSKYNDKKNDKLHN